MKSGFRIGVAAAALLLAVPSTSLAQGLYLPGGGAAHLSMGGASSATPVDAIGALYWNPAAIGRLGRSEASVGGAFLFPDINLSSTAPGPLGLRSGTTHSDSGVGIASSLGIVMQPDDSPLTYGMGLNTIGGGGVNFPGDTRNPILAGIGPLGNVQGPIAASMTLAQLSPTVAYKVTDRLVFGVGPTIDIAATNFDPAYFGSPNVVNSVGTFPTASHSRPFWGGGVRAGLVYSATEKLDIGFGYTSPQWFEPWKYNARDAAGLPRTLTLNATLPAIYSWGIGYKATEKWLLVLDLRYMDYKNTQLFGTPVVDGGLGWKSVFVAALGSRYQVTDKVALSAGYIYNDNPIPSTGTLFNMQSPAINQHTVTVGSTMNLTDRMSTSIGYAYGFRNTLTGPVREAAGVGVSLDSQVHMLTFTMQFKFGGCGCSRPPVTPTDYNTAPVSLPVGSSMPPGPSADPRIGG